MDIGQNIKQIRKERRMTLIQLSSMCGISVSFLSDIERGARLPSIEKLFTLAQKLNVSVDRLFGVPFDIPLHHDSLAIVDRLLSDTKGEETLTLLGSYSDWSEQEKDELLGYLKVRSCVKNSKK